MSVAATHPAPWTAEDLYALPEDGMRHELLDGTLLVSPPPSVPHQFAARRLVAALVEAAGPDLELDAVGGPAVLAFALDAGSYRQSGEAVGSSRTELLVPFPVALAPEGLRGPRA